MTEADVFQALNEIGFEKYVEQLQDFMRNYNADREDVVGAKSAVNRRRVFEGVSVAHRGGGDDHDMAGGQPSMQVKRHRDEVDDGDDEVIDLKTEKK